jgi:hypothetical protein
MFHPSLLNKEVLICGREVGKKDIWDKHGREYTEKEIKSTKK